VYTVRVRREVAVKAHLAALSRGVRLRDLVARELRRALAAESDTLEREDQHGREDTQVHNDGAS
jgi:hypothetical protein